jgi:small subunit ribosomal protein S6
MNSYEMMYIVRPDMGEESVRQVVDKYRDFINQYNCQDIQVKILGKKRLAYPIQKYQDGIYVQMNYEGDGSQVAPLERDMRLGDEVIRYLTIKLKSTASTVPDTVAPPVAPAVEA